MFEEVVFSVVVLEATEVAFVTELFVEFEFEVVVLVLVVVDCNVVVDVLIEEALTDVEFDTFSSVVETVVVEVVVVRDDVWLLTPLTNIVLLAITMLATVLFTEFELKVAVS